VSDVDATTRMPDAVRLQALMVSYQAGDLTAFDHVYVLLAPVIEGFLRRRSLTAATLDDLVQETFLQMHRARRTYDPAYPLMPWVLAIARHCWLMELRRASRRPTSDVDIEDVPLTVRSGAESHEARVDVHRALTEVPDGQREALVAHHVWGLSFHEVGAQLGITGAAAKLRSSRGMRRLRNLLGRGGA
jgi:RNA polymerase sigma-70 factor (ECF subfamily)